MEVTGCTNQACMMSAGYWYEVAPVFSPSTIKLHSVSVFKCAHLHIYVSMLYLHIIINILHRDKYQLANVPRQLLSIPSNFGVYSAIGCPCSGEFYGWKDLSRIWRIRNTRIYSRGIFIFINNTYA